MDAKMSGAAQALECWINPAFDIDFERHITQPRNFFTFASVKNEI